MGLGSVTTVAVADNSSEIPTEVLEQLNLNDCKPFIIKSTYPIISPTATKYGKFIPECLKSNSIMAVQLKVGIDKNLYIKNSTNIWKRILTSY